MDRFGGHSWVKRVVSVSLGSSRRDHRAEVELLGESFIIERFGTDGDIRRAAALVHELDGRADAIGLGGIDLYLQVRQRRYVVRDACRISAAARVTPVLDGNGLKNSLEPWVIRALQEEHEVDFRGKRILMVSAVDRFGMAQALVQAGGELLFGDLIFGLKVPIALRSLRALEWAGAVLLPIVTRLPFKMLYPTGAKQEGVQARFTRYFRWADVVAGDFHFIRRYMPDSMEGKVVITNTITSEDVEELRCRGVHRLVTTTPELNGRSFGTNVLEAILVALSGSRRELTPQEYLALLQRLAFRPRVVELNPARD